MSLRDEPPVFDWGRWGVIRSENEDLCSAEEMTVPPFHVGSHQPYVPAISPPEAAPSRSMSLRDDPPVFDWGRWGVIPSENVDLCGPEEMVPPFHVVSHQPYVPAIGSGGNLHGVDVEEDERPVFDWDARRGVVPVIGSGGPSHGIDVVDPEGDIMEPFDMGSFVDRLVGDSPHAKAAYTCDAPNSYEEIMDPFDMESFVDRLVRDSPQAKAAYICDAPVAADTPREVVTKSGNGGLPPPSPGAKPVFSAIQIQPQKRKHGDGTAHMEVWNNGRDNPVSTVDAAAPRQLIVADDDNRHTFLRQQEIVHRVGPGYLAGFGQPGVVDRSQRTALVDHVTKLHAAAPAASGGGPPLSLGTLFLAVNLVDRFLSTDEGGLVVFGGRGGLKVAGAACLGIASKYEDTQSVATSLWGLAVAGTRGEIETVRADDDELHAARKDIAAMELGVLSALSYRLTVPTALSFLEEFIWRASRLGHLPEGPVSETVRTEAQQILQRVLRDVTWLEHVPSALAAAALYWASCESSPGVGPPSSSAFFAITGYQPEILCRCLRDTEAVRTGGGGTGRRDGGLGFD